MEPDNLQAASTYINNVLLARGLLKNGRPIDFAEPENEEGGTGATMGKIINLVNDLVLRRDVRCSTNICYCSPRTWLTIYTARGRTSRESSNHNPRATHRRFPEDT
jgi:hypothetical protein